MKLRNGMKVKIVRILSGGEFPIGTTGVIKSYLGPDYFHVHAKGDFWVYNSKEVEPLKSGKSKISKPTRRQRGCLNAAQRVPHKRVSVTVRRAGQRPTTRRPGMRRAARKSK